MHQQRLVIILAYDDEAYGVGLLRQRGGAVSSLAGLTDKQLHSAFSMRWPQTRTSMNSIVACPVPRSSQSPASFNRYTLTRIA